MTLTVNATTDCAASEAVCADDGGMLEGGAQATIAGPAALSGGRRSRRGGRRGDAGIRRDDEPRAGERTSVDYATSDGNARAGDDYDAASGRLTFEPGDTEKTIEVTVLNDAHDEAEETMTLTLSNASGARIEDGTVTGTIENTDPMPKAWMVRFGRTVGSQVVDALIERLDGARSSHVTVGGIRLRGETPDEPEAKDDDLFALPAWATAAARGGRRRSMSGRELLLGSAFHLSSAGEGAGGGPAFTAWGRVATGGFEAEEDDVTMDGDVTTGMVGFDAEWERLLAGVMLSQSEGEGSLSSLDAKPRQRRRNRRELA